MAAPIDIVVFTGDLAFSAASEQYHRAVDMLIEPLQELLSLPRERVVLVPGNHDVDRTEIDEDEEAGLRAKLVDREQVDRLLDDSARLAGRTKRMNAWYNFVREFYGNTDRTELGGLLRLFEYEIDGATIGVASINTAWRASGDDDANYLLVGDRQAKAAGRYVDSFNLRIAAQHHPLHWLARFDAQTAEHELLQHFDILLTGHMHEAEPSGVQKATGGYLISAAGSLYGDDGRNWANSYSVLNIDPVQRKVAVELREYQPKREAFDAAVSVAARGISELFLPARAVASSNASVGYLGIATSKLHEFRDAAAMLLVDRLREQSVLAQTIEDPAGYLPPVERLAAFVVEPTFQNLPGDERLIIPAFNEREPFREADRKQLDTDEVLAQISGSRPLVVVGEGGTGLSTALVWILLHAAVHNRGHIPIVISGEAGQGQRAFDTAARTALAAAGVGIRREDPLPPMLVAVDDAHLLDSRKLARLKTFMDDNAHSQFILGCRDNDVTRVSDSLISDDLGKLPIVYLGNIGHKNLRALVRRVARGSEDRILSLVSGLAGRNDVGRTPFLLTALIRLAVADESLQGTADTVVITQSYAGFLLGRDNRFENSRVDMTFRNREDILSKLAAKIVQEGDTGIVKRLEVERFLVDYFESVGWSQPVGHVVDDLILRWVLFEVRPGEIAFRQRSMHAYFCALRATDDPIFRQWLLQEPIRWSLVIGYMAGLPKNDIGLLQTIAQSLPVRRDRGTTFSPGESDSMSEEVKSDFAELNEEALGQEGTAEAEVDASDDSAETFELDVDSLLDSLVFGGGGSFQLGVSIDGADTVNGYAMWTHLASVVLRSSELVTDTELKHTLFRQLLVRWADVADLLVNTVPEQAKRFAEDIRAAEDAVGHEGMSEELIDDILTQIDVSVSLTASVDTLSSVKLDKALQSFLLDPAAFEDAGAALVAAAIAADGRVDGWLNFLVQLLNDFGHIRAVRCGVLYISFLAYQSGARRDDAAKIERLFADAATNHLSFKSGTEKTARRNFVISGLKRASGRSRRALPR